MFIIKHILFDIFIKFKKKQLNNFCSKKFKKPTLSLKYLIIKIISSFNDLNLIVIFKYYLLFYKQFIEKFLIILLIFYPKQNQFVLLQIYIKIDFNKLL